MEDSNWIVEGESEKSYCGIYKELVEVIGDVNFYQIYLIFSCVKVTFPIHLYTIEYVAMLAIVFSIPLKELASKYGYSERHISRKKKELEESLGTLNEKR